MTSGTKNVEQRAAILKGSKRRNKGLPYHGSIATVQAIYLHNATNRIISPSHRIEESNICFYGTQFAPNLQNSIQHN